MYCRYQPVQFDSRNHRRLSPRAVRRVIQPHRLRRWPSVPAVLREADREYALLGARLFLIAPRAAEGRRRSRGGSSAWRSLGLHDVGVTAEPCTNGLMPIASPSGLTCTIRSSQPAAVRSRIDHLAGTLPGGVHVQQRKRRPGRKEAFTARCSITELSLPIEYSITAARTRRLPRAGCGYSRSSRDRCDSLDIETAMLPRKARHSIMWASLSRYLAYSASGSVSGTHDRADIVERRL